MATKIGFQLTTQPTTFDPSAGLKDVLDTLNTQEKDRETQRQKWRDEQDEFFKSANDLKATPNQQANEFFGKWSGGLMSEATELQSALENGRINSRDYTAQFRNLTQSNEQMIGAQKNYQTNAQRVADGVADGSLSSINSTDFNEYNKALELGAIEVERDGRGGFKVFNKNTGKVYNPYQLNNLTIGNIPRFDYNKAAATAVTQFGKRGIKDAAGNTVKGVYANMPGAELDILMEREAKVFVGSNQARTASILVDGLGYDVVYDKKDLKENTILKNQDGTFTFTEADEAAAVNEMKTALKNALPKDIEDAPITTPKPPTDRGIDRGAEKDKKIGYLQTIDNAFSGNSKTSQAAIDSMIARANKSNKDDKITNVTRSQDGTTMTVTVVNKDGNTITTPYDITNPNASGEIFLELFYPEVKGSYKQALKDFSLAEGGFTQRQIENPKYTVDEKGLPTDPNEKQFIPNPNYRGASQSSKTPSEVTISQDFDSAEVLGESAGDEKPLSEVIDEVDMSKMYMGNFGLRRSENMAKGAEDAFSIIKEDLPNLDARAIATESGLILKIPSLFEGDLLLPNSNDPIDKTKYKNAIKQIFNSIAKGTPFNKSDFQ